MDGVDGVLDGHEVHMPLLSKQATVFSFVSQREHGLIEPLSLFSQLELLGCSTDWAGRTCIVCPHLILLSLSSPLALTGSCSVYPI